MLQRNTYSDTINMTDRIFRGSVIFYNHQEYKMLDDNQTSVSIQKGIRPAVVISSRAGVSTSSIITIVPLTSKNKSLSIYPKIQWHKPPYDASYALCNQIQTIPKSQVISVDSVVCQNDMDLIMQGVQIALGIPTQDTATSCTEDDIADSKVLIPQAMALIEELQRLTKRYEQPVSVNSGKKVTRIKLSKEEILAFVTMWHNSTPAERKAHLEEYHFTNYNSAFMFYHNHKGEMLQ